MADVLTAVGIFLGIFLGVPLVLFHGKILYALTDGRAIKALAASECPQCAGSVGMPDAIAASEDISRKYEGVRVIEGGYVPAVYHPTWHLSCPSCHAKLAFDVARRTLTRVSA